MWGKLKIKLAHSRIPGSKFDDKILLKQTDKPSQIKACKKREKNTSTYYVVILVQTVECRE